MVIHPLTTLCAKQPELACWPEWSVHRLILGTSAWCVLLHEESQARSFAVRWLWGKGHLPHRAILCLLVWCSPDFQALGKIQEGPLRVFCHSPHDSTLLRAPPFNPIKLYIFPSSQASARPHQPVLSHWYIDPVSMIDPKEASFWDLWSSRVKKSWPRSTAKLKRYKIHKYVLLLGLPLYFLWP